MRDGYDAMAERFLDWSASIVDGPRSRFVAEFDRCLAPGSRVLDLGCGAGVPSMLHLAERFDVVGVDISERQLGLARARVPAAALVRADLARVAFADGAFHGIAALYSLSHVPRESHAGLFRRLAAWLAPDGLLLATLGVAGLPDWTGPWLGVPMFFSSHDAETNRALLRAAGFELVLDEVVEIREPEGPVAFLWVLARRPDEPR